MKCVHFQYGSQRFLGRCEDGIYHAFEVIGDPYPTYSPWLLAKWNEFATRDAIESFDSGDVVTLAPIPNPEKIICVGRNYAAHAAEMGATVEDLPVIFNKFPGCTASHNSEIEIPEISSQVDFEAELVVVIGRSGRNISVADAMDHVFGYCCGNDVSARDWQKGRPGGQWLLGKSFDGFAPVGPWIVTRDEIDPGQLQVQLKLNGRIMQDDNTSGFVFKIDFLISHLSKFCTLQPGDLLFTGTPAGVGAGRTPPVFLKPGDETIVEIEGIGELRNTFTAPA